MDKKSNTIVRLDKNEETFVFTAIKLSEYTGIQKYACENQCSIPELIIFVEDSISFSF